MNKNLGLFVLAIVFLTTVSLVGAQQPTKMPRIGYLGTSPSAIAARIEAFRQGLRELGYVEGKNIFIEWRHVEGKPERMSELAAELVRLKVDIIITGYRSCWEWVCRQPGASRRQHYWIGNPSPRDTRKTTGASKGGYPQALPRGRLRDFDRPGQRAIVKRDRTRRKGVRRAASIPRCTRSQRY